MTLSRADLEIARFCAIECELQRSGERSVWWMLDAWRYANETRRSSPTRRDPPVLEDVIELGRRVEPEKNKNGFRQIGVRVDFNVKLDWRLVPDAMDNLVNGGQALLPEEWFFEFEEIHPFIDGNGRTGAILYNWLRGSLDRPVWPPNFWNDERRQDGEGSSPFTAASTALRERVEAEERESFVRYVLDDQELTSYQRRMLRDAARESGS